MAYIEAQLISKEKNLTWLLYAFLLTVFAMATPFELRFSVHGWMSLSEAAAKIESGSLSRQVSLITLGVFAIVSLFWDSRNRIRINGVLGYIVIFFLFLAVLSVIYSINRMFTIRRVVVLFMLSLGALAVAKRLTLRQILLLAFCAGIFSLVSGFLCEVVLGTFKPFEGVYRFTGVLGPNFQASNCSMLLIAAVALAHKAKGTRIRSFYLAIACLSFVFLILTKSRGGMVGATVGLVTYGGLMSPRKTAVCLFTILFFACAVYLVASDELGAFGKRLLTLGRTDIGDIGQNLTTLTGRTHLWTTTVFSATQEHLLFGYGYDSFWSASRVAAQKEGYELGSTHNGYLHILLGLGLTGAITYVLIRILGIIAYIRLFRKARNTEHASAVALLISFSLIIVFLDLPLKPYLATFIDMTILAKIAFIARSAHNRGF